MRGVHRSAPTTMAEPVTYDSCIFCTIAAGKDPATTLLVDTEQFVAFPDIAPVATHHYLVITKRHIKNVKQLKRDDISMVNAMKEIGIQLLQSKGLNIDEARFGFHWPPFNTVNHLHLHCIAPVSTMSFFHRQAFKPGTSWFATVEETTKWLEKQD